MWRYALERILFEGHQPHPIPSKPMLHALPVISCFLTYIHPV